MLLTKPQPLKEIQRIKTTHKAFLRAFTLVELLVVISIIAALSVIVIPAVSSMSAADDVNQAAARIENVLSEAVSFAKANNTYVRLGFYESKPLASNPTAVDNEITLLLIYSASGRSDTDVENQAEWPMLTKAITFRGVSLDSSLGISTDSVLTTTSFASFSRSIAGQTLAFNKQIQFDPSGTARVESNTVSRAIKIGLASRQQTANSAVVRLSGVSGQVTLLRAEELAKL